MFIKMEREGKGAEDLDYDNEETDQPVKEDNFRGTELRDLGTAELPYGGPRP